MFQKNSRLSCIALALIMATAVSACSRQTAEEKGKELATEKIDMVKGIGGALEDKGGAAAESVASGVGNVVKGLGKGIEKSSRSIVVAPSVEQAGLQITKVQEPRTLAGPDALHGLEAYVVANAQARGTLRVIVYDLLDKEIGRTRVELVRDADEGKYLAIPLDKEISLSAIAKISFEFLPVSPQAAKI